MEVAPTEHVAHGDTCDCGNHHTSLYGATMGAALGASVNYYFGAHINAGRSAQQVLYHYDFQNDPRADPASLNRFGRAKLRRLARSMEFTGAPLIIQHVPGNLALSEARRSHVIEIFQSRLGVPLYENQVVISAAQLPGLRGVEAAEIRRNQLQTTRAQGIIASGFQSGVTNNISTGTGNSR